MAAFLQVLGAKGAPERFILPTDSPVIIGRGEGCELRIEHRSLSRLHCVVEHNAGYWQVSDCSSMNGTRVSGFRVSETVVQPGEVIQVGDVRIEFGSDSPADRGSTGSGNVPRFPLAGRHFGRFELLRCLHVGSTGTVYLAREIDKEKNRYVALKVLGRDRVVDETTRKRFERGVRAAAPLSHSGIVQLFATGKTEGQTWLTMEWIDGPSIRDLLQREQKLSIPETVRIIRGLASAIESIASQGVVHRNITPSNILITPSGEPKLIDFILARRVDEDQANRVSQAGEIVGDMEYLAPECFSKPDSVDFHADIYSLGVCMYAMLTGRTPFSEANISLLMQRVLHDPVPAPSQSCPEIPRQFESIILRCLAKDPCDRFDTPRQLFESLAALGDLAPTPITHHRSPAPDSSGLTIVENAPAELPISLDDDPVSLPSSGSRSSGSWRRLLILPKPSNAPSPRPWSTLIATIIVVVGIGSLILFGDRLWSGCLRDESTEATASPGEIETKPHVPSATPPTTGRVPGPVEPIAPESKRTATAPANPERLVVEPGTPLRNIAQAIDVARDGQVIEVASNDKFRGEVRLPAKSLTLVASPEFHPTFGNTLRINGGGTIRVEGFHFEPYVANKPAIEVEKMPEKLEISGCSFRGSEGVLIALRSTAASSGRRPQLVLERSFAAGDIVFGLAGLPPDLRLTQSCLAAHQTVVDWQLATGDLSGPAACDFTLRKNTLLGRSMFHVRLADQQRPIEQLPQTTIQLDDNIFAFPARFPCSFFRWESWQRPDIFMEGFVWNGSNNAFSGLGTWSMATTLVLSDPAATPQVVIATPDDWQSKWADQVTNILKVPPEFEYAGPPKKISEIKPFDYELIPQSKQREAATDGGPLGADIKNLPTPPTAQ